MSSTTERAGAQDEVAARLGRPVASLRTHTARGTLINSAFQIGLSGLGALQRIVIAAFLTTAEFGLWGLVISIIVTLAFLKEFGIADKYIQQSEPDQEAAFQKAFTIELFSSIAFVAFIAALMPLWALVYGEPDIILPGILTAVAVPIMAFKSPIWIYYRRMQYLRQRLLMSVDPVVTFVVTVALAIAGAGYWSFVGGIFAGSTAGAIAAVASCPYPLRLRFDSGSVREYARFSWPLIGAGMSGLLVVQGSVVAAESVVGLAGVGAIALATSIAIFADRADHIISQTIYPAVCAVVDRRHLLAEVFVKTNRVALMWAVPFGVGLALFSDDLVHFVLGERWRDAAGLLAAFGLTCALGQVAFNWTVFQRALNDTRPMFWSSVINIGVFAAVSVPLILELGLTGYALGFAAANTVQVAIRGFYMRRMFREFSVLRQLARAFAPTVPAAALILSFRLVDGSGYSAPVTIAELAAYAVAVLAFTMLLERKLIREILEYVRGRDGFAGMSRVPGAPPEQPSQA
jgi:O-antigen/teichoic acid export membrane protein